MEPRVFPKVSRVRGVPGVNVKLSELISGDLVFDGRALEHRSYAGTIRMDPVRAITIETSVITVAYGQGDQINSERLVDMSRGLLRSRGTSRALASQLQMIFGHSTLNQAEASVLERGAATEMVEALAPVGKRGRLHMQIGGVVAIIGLILLAAAINASSSAAFIFLFMTSMGVIEFWNGFRTNRRVRKTTSNLRPMTGPPHMP